jgi:Putative viral replication protein
MSVQQLQNAGQTGTRARQARAWCFTLNNYTDDDVAHLLGLDTVGTTSNSVRYMIFGKEVAPETLTPHLQGYVLFKKQKRLGGVQSLLTNRAHYSVAMTQQEAIDYCKKDGDFYEIGSLITQERARCDLKDYMAAVKQMTDDKQIDIDILKNQFPKICAKYPRFFYDMIKEGQKKMGLAEIEDTQFELRPWQIELKNILDGEPDDRKIIFVVDVIGNGGKTRFSHWYRRQADPALAARIALVVPGKKADMAYTLIPNPKVVIFDAPRSKQAEYIQYCFLEQLKNGYIMSSKYESTLLEFKPPHVVVMMNEEPDMRKLSADRYHIIQLSDYNDVTTDP